MIGSVSTCSNVRRKSSSVSAGKPADDVRPDSAVRNAFADAGDEVRELSGSIPALHSRENGVAAALERDVEVPGEHRRCCQQGDDVVAERRRLSSIELSRRSTSSISRTRGDAAGVHNVDVGGIARADRLEIASVVHERVDRLGVVLIQPAAECVVGDSLAHGFGVSIETMHGGGARLECRASLRLVAALDSPPLHRNRPVRHRRRMHW